MDTQYEVLLLVDLCGSALSTANQSNYDNATDKDGRTYVVVATLTDVAGNSASATITIVVPHDQGN